ncbi:PD-(D/E)XK nuclease family protein [Thermanaerovibrio velox]
MGLLRLCGEAASSGWEFLPTMRLVSSVMEIDLEKLMTQQPRGLAPWREFIRSQCGEDAERRFRRLADFGALLLKGATPMRLLEEALAVMKAADPERMSEAVKDMHNLDWTVRAVTSSIEEMEKKIFSLSEGLDLLGQAFQDPLNLRDAMEFLGIWGSSSYTVQDQPLDGAVRVYRDAPPVLAEHRLFVLCGADQSRWPGKLSESPMMGEPYRERVNSSFLERPDLTPTHLVSLHERRKAKEAMFIRMALAGRDAFVLTQGATDKDGRPVPPTPFARSLREMGAPAEDVNGPGDLLPSERFIRGVEFPRHPAPSWEEAGTTTYVVKVSPDEGGGKRRLPLSGLDSFVKCPFRYACENLLKIKPPERKPVPRFLLGELAHEAMKIASSRPNMSSPEEILDKVKALPSAEPILKPGRGRYLQRLSDMIGRGIDWLGARKKGLEENGLRLICSITEATLPGIEMDNHIGTGRADLVDVIECQGVRGYVILDFKTGFSSDYKDSLQVAAYAKALKAASSGEGIKELKGAKLLGFGFLSFSDMLDHLRWNSFTSEKSKSPNKDNCIGIMWTSRDGLGTPNLIQGAYRLYQPKGTTGDNAEEGSGGSKAGRDPIYAEDMISKASQAMEDLDEALRNGSFEAKHRYYTIRRDVCSKCPYGDLCRRLEAGHDFEEEQEGGEGDEL